MEPPGGIVVAGVDPLASADQRHAMRGQLSNDPGHVRRQRPRRSSLKQITTSIRPRRTAAIRASRPVRVNLAPLIRSMYSTGGGAVAVFIQEARHRVSGHDDNTETW